MKIQYKIIIVLSILFFATLFVDCSKRQDNEYVVLYTTGTTTEIHHSKTSRYEVVPTFLWSIKNVKTGQISDREVTFSTFSRFGVGDHVIFNDPVPNTAFENLVLILRFALIAFMFGLMIWSI
ncbi:MAG TPA: hypothetical protein VFM18_20300 [Methanosarcina sp.]|nr:hypothetical protein [Methanosarcina sp.]